MTIRRVAVIYDDRPRPETTGVYCRRALGKLIQVEHFLPDELARLSPGDFDLYVNVDDGLRYHLPSDLRPAALWMIDSHIDPDWCLEKAAGFDFVFAAQKDGAASLSRQGVEAQWLPLACDPQIHRPHRVHKSHDVGFVGNVFPGPRAELLRAIQTKFPNSFVGQAFFDDMARVYSASRLAFNRSLKNDVNMRVFEAVACGTLLLTNDLTDNGQEELLQNGVHLATYSCADELLDKIEFFLRRQAARLKMAREGRAAVLARHTYALRMEQLLRAVERNASKRLVVNGLATHKAKAAHEAHDPAYFEFDRPEIVALVPESARRVLEIGCGGGRLGARLKERQACRVVGVEQDPLAAAEATRRLDRVLVGDVETMEPDFHEREFDCLVCGDVLEHLDRPLDMLVRARRWLSADATVIASIPNARHHSVVTGLLDGNWTYEPAGLLDDTHRQFFTRRDITDLFAEAGYEIREWGLVPGSGHPDWVAQGQSGNLRIGRLELTGLSPADAEEFFVYQWLVKATPAQTRVIPHGAAAAQQQPRDVEAPATRLGCVLAVKDRPILELERTLETFAYQSIQPADRLLLDYGSTADRAADYRDICQRFGWRYVRTEPPTDEWSLPSAYNLAVSALHDSIDVVFKSDGEILLGPGALAAALRFGRERLVVFSCVTTQEGTTYPRCLSPDSLGELLLQDPRPQEMLGWGVHAFPRGWFTKVGGYDLEYSTWGCEDADLRLRTARSIGIVDVTSVLLVHQWHPRSRTPQQQDRIMRNLAYYECTKAEPEIVRNQGRLAPPNVRLVAESQVAADSQTPAKPPRIPNVLHFCFGMSPDFGGKPFSFVHYLALCSALEVNRPEAARLYYCYEPRGPWWQRIRHRLELIRIEAPTEIFGRPLLHGAHRADVVRLRSLYEQGGIYLDLDVLCLRPFTPLLGHDVVMGQETDGGLCNAVLLAPAGAPFLQRWIESYRTFRSHGRDEYWGEHSVQVPARLAREFPQELEVLGPRAFFWPMHWEQHLEKFFRGSDGEEFCGESYCAHLWEQLSWERYLKDLTPERIRSGRSEFCRLAQRFLEFLE